MIIKEIKENYELYLNDNKINFFFKYNFEKEGKNTIKIISNTLLKRIDYMFYQCSSLNLSNFNTINIINMSNKFGCCSSLTSFNLFNFNTNNVHMYEMFSGIKKDCNLICNDKEILKVFFKIIL